MNKAILTGILLFLCLGLNAQEETRQQLDELLSDWHKAAARADFDAYFGLMTPDAVFIGTDATEYWTGEEFKAFSKPYFDRGKAWSFAAVERHIYLNKAEDMAWFDELLDTQMKLCRGSGILQKTDDGWKIAHYVLSIAVPNDKVETLIELKREQDSLLTLKLTRP